MRKKLEQKTGTKNWNKKRLDCEFNALTIASLNRAQSSLKKTVFKVTQLGGFY